MITFDTPTDEQRQQLDQLIARTHAHPKLGGPLTCWSCHRHERDVEPMMLSDHGTFNDTVHVDLCATCRDIARDDLRVTAAVDAVIDCIHCGHPFTTGRGSLNWDANLCRGCYQ